MQEADGQGAPSQEPEERQLRASDDERHRVVESLGEHAAAGRLTLGELEERVGVAYAATTRGELAELTRDLPALPESGSARAKTGKVRRRARWFVAILGGSSRRGRMRLAERVNVVAVLGGDDIDLRDAEFVGNEVIINVFCFLGGPDIYVPDTVEVELSGPVILGGNDEHGGSRPPRTGAPLVRIRSFALLGGSDVWRVPAESRALGLKQARRAAKALQRGEE